MLHGVFAELMGDISGRRVLDRGCGGGQLAFFLAEAGAAGVVGIGASERMLEVARAERSHPRVIYRRATMEEADPDGTRVAWALDRYAEEGAREHRWFVPGVRRFHGTIATLINRLVDAGLAIERVLEPAPGEVWLRERPQDTDERRRPMFLLVRSRKA